MANRRYECIECDAVFKVGHDLDEDYYDVEFCPFCGSELTEDEKDTEEIEDNNW